MSRKKTASLTRGVKPDPRHQSVQVAKFINSLMYDGERSVAEKIVYGAIEKLGGRIKDAASPLEAFGQAVENVKPLVEVKSRRVGGANYQVPVEVRPERRQALAFR